MDVKDLKPEIVFGFFDEITKVPRPSKKEEKIISYLKGFAEKQGFDYKTDICGNIIIYKPAQNSSSTETVILQSHVDMVCEKNSDKVFDFEKDPIRTYCENGWVKADGTTLGADCGIGMAIELAVLASKDISHPAIEALFTVDEETGLTGAFGLEKGILSGKYLINLDSEDEGEIFVGCAGGVDTIASFDILTERVKDNSAFLKLAIKGLKGGHSGDDINKGYANANILLSRFLVDARKKYDIQLVGIDGGNLRNAIPREAWADIAVDKKFTAQIESDFKAFCKLVNSEYHATEGAITVIVTECEKAEHTIEKQLTERVINSIFTTVNGIVAMSFDIKDLVETSTNLASVKMKEGKIVISTSQRSSVNSKREWLSEVMDIHFKTFGATVVHSDGYPGWTPKMDSELLKTAAESYKSIFGTDAKIKAIHAGLECGLFLEKYPWLEMVSVGPTLRRVHSPEEMLEISTVDKCWLLIKETLKRL